jgi:hypothetical protein
LRESSQSRCVETLKGSWPFQGVRFRPWWLVVVGEAREGDSRESGEEHIGGELPRGQKPRRAAAFVERLILLYGRCSDPGREQSLEVWGWSPVYRRVARGKKVIGPERVQRLCQGERS